eukprot:1910394-Pyramimonas_sp.AAC.1
MARGRKNRLYILFPTDPQFEVGLLLRDSNVFHSVATGRERTATTGPAGASSSIPTSSPRPRTCQVAT